MRSNGNQWAVEVWDSILGCTDSFRTESQAKLYFKILCNSIRNNTNYAITEDSVIELSTGDTVIILTNLDEL